MRLLLVFVFMISLVACSIKRPDPCVLPNNTQQATLTMQELKPKYQELLRVASAALNKSYAPYSKFHVAAAVLTEDGTIITGNNVENAAWASICAERAAIVNANAQGKRDIVAIAIIAQAYDSQGHIQAVPEPIAPCGVCRQVIYEFALDHDIDIIMSNTARDKIIIKTISELLPMAFGPKDIASH